jgi:hypothetical protein
MELSMNGKYACLLYAGFISAVIFLSCDSGNPSSATLFQDIVGIWDVTGIEADGTVSAQGEFMGIQIDTSFTVDSTLAPAAGAVTLEYRADSTYVTVGLPGPSDTSFTSARADSGTWALNRRELVMASGVTGDTLRSDVTVAGNTLILKIPQNAVLSVFGVTTTYDVLLTLTGSRRR